MSNYSENRTWSDRFIDEIKGIVGPHLLRVTPDEIDRTQAADLMVFTAQTVTIAARVRRPGYYQKYPNEFTIRAKLKSGGETELSKIINGWGTWMFYGHSAPCETKLAAWMLIDLNAFRASLIREARNSTYIKCGDKSNDDGSHFKWFDAGSFPRTPPLLISARGIPLLVAA